METFSALSPVNSPHKGQWRGTLMFSLICARINCWVNNHEAGDLRRHPTHYDVIVMAVRTNANLTTPLRSGSPSSTQPRVIGLKVMLSLVIGNKSPLATFLRSFIHFWHSDKIKYIFLHPSLPDHMREISCLSLTSDTVVIRSLDDFRW